MADEVETGLETEVKDEHWSAEHEDIKGDADLAKWTEKFTDIAAMAKSGRELEQKMASSYRLPDDLKSLTDEQKADILAKTTGLRDIPEKPEGYELEIPDDIEKDEAFIEAFKVLAHGRKISTGDAQALADFYMNAQKGGKEKANQETERAAATAEQELRMFWGHEYDTRMKGVEIARTQAAKALNLGYRNDADEVCSKLDDALDTKDANGRRLGNNPAILQLLDYAYNNLWREAEPVGGSAGTGDKAGGVMSDSFYANPT